MECLLRIVSRMPPPTDIPPGHDDGTDTQEPSILMVFGARRGGMCLSEKPRTCRFVPPKPDQASRRSPGLDSVPTRLNSTCRFLPATIPGTEGENSVLALGTAHQHRPVHSQASMEWSATATADAPTTAAAMPPAAKQAKAAAAVTSRNVSLPRSRMTCWLSRDTRISARSPRETTRLEDVEAW
jgi:hypothetical protein